MPSFLIRERSNSCSTIPETSSLPSCSPHPACSSELVCPRPTRGRLLRLIFQGGPPAPQAASLRHPSRRGVALGSASPLCRRVRVTGCLSRRRDNCSGLPHHRASLPPL